MKPPTTTPAEQFSTTTQDGADKFGMSPRSQARPDRVVTTLAIGRTTVGLLMLTWPGLLPALLSTDRATSTTMAWSLRLVGSREVAIGLGSLAAGRAEPSSARSTWLAANMITDATDSVALTMALANGTVARRPAAAMAALAAALATNEAVLLTRRGRAS